MAKVAKSKQASVSAQERRNSWHGTLLSRFHSYSKRQIILSVGVVGTLVAFSAFELTQVRQEASARLNLTAQFLAAELSDTDGVSAPSILSFLKRQVPSGTQIYLVASDGNLAAATGEVALGSIFSEERALAGSLSAKTNISGDLGAAIVTRSHALVLREAWLPIGVGSALSALLLVLVWWRNAKTSVDRALPDMDTETEKLFGALPVGMAVWTANGHMISCNDQYRRFLQLYPSEAKPGAAYVKTMEIVSDRHDVSVTEEADALRQVEISRADDVILLIDERPVGAGGFVTLISDITGEKQVSRDLERVQEDQQELERQLREEKMRAESASRAKTSFLAHLSHDVRTPLNHIIGFADLISHQTYGPVGDKRYLNYIEDIKGSGKKLLASFAEILELAQLEGGHMVLRRERFEISEVIRATAERFERRAQRIGVDLDLSVPDNTELCADRICIERMLSNIVENAIQFTPTGGKIKLAAWLAEDGVVLEVSDTGIGMSEDRLGDLSQPFVLGDAAFTRESQGVGLGIAISRAIAELSGGALAIDSSPAMGTTVAISLPLEPARSKSVAHAA